MCFALTGIVASDLLMYINGCVVIIIRRQRVAMTV